MDETLQKEADTYDAFYFMFMNNSEKKTLNKVESVSGWRRERPGEGLGAGDGVEAKVSVRVGVGGVLS